AESDRRAKRRRRAAVPQNLGLKSQDRNRPVVLYNGMTNAHAINLLSPRTKSLLRLHAKAIGVDEARLASDLFAMMVRDAQNLQRRATTAPVATNVIPLRVAERVN
ncbi:MAG: hypothetical protein WBE53_17935, partial [Pseudolabrys sp.]